MPSTPTTKSQVQAYRFVLRRMESALTRKDAVMLHEPMRTHQRALAAGALLAVVGVLGFLIFGVLKPKGSLPKDGGIVISKQTGAVYVVAGNPQQLIPTPNIASAKLLLM
ncbi:type VII secretion protein EccB, partial [Streptomyces griseoaurantiacus]